VNDQLPWEWLNGGEPLVPDMIPEALKRPWLNAAATSEQIIDDTVIAVKINAMEAHWDDVVPCNVTDGSCERPAYWVYHCPCGRPATFWTPHKVRADTWLGPVLCGLCRCVWPSPIPWLPL
jgi:hypothetical protein